MAFIKINLPLRGYNEIKHYRADQSALCGVFLSTAILSKEKYENNSYHKATYKEALDTIKLYARHSEKYLFLPVLVYFAKEQNSSLQGLTPKVLVELVGGNAQNFKESVESDPNLFRYMKKQQLVAFVAGMLDYYKAAQSGNTLLTTSEEWVTGYLCSGISFLDEQKVTAAFSKVVGEDFEDLDNVVEEMKENYIGSNGTDSDLPRNLLTAYFEQKALPKKPPQSILKKGVPLPGSRTEDNPAEEKKLKPDINNSEEASSPLLLSQQSRINLPVQPQKDLHEDATSKKVTMKKILTLHIQHNNRLQTT